MPHFEPVWFSIGILIGVILGLIAERLYRAANRERKWKEKRGLLAHRKF